MNPDQRFLIYEGKAKRIFQSDQSDQVVVQFKNDATAFIALKRAELEDKGRVNCQISSYIFKRIRILCHFVDCYMTDTTCTNN